MEGERLFICINITEYEDTKQNRTGAEKNTVKLIETFQESVDLRNDLAFWHLTEAQDLWINHKSTSVKKHHGFNIKLHLWGYIKKNEAIEKLEKFVEDCPNENNVKIITCALMGHGLNMRQENAEGDWCVKYISNIVFA